MRFGVVHQQVHVGVLVAVLAAAPAQRRHGRQRVPLFQIVAVAVELLAAVVLVVEKVQVGEARDPRGRVRLAPDADVPPVGVLEVVVGVPHERDLRGVVGGPVRGTVRRAHGWRHGGRRTRGRVRRRRARRVGRRRRRRGVVVARESAAAIVLGLEEPLVRVALDGVALVVDTEHAPVRPGDHDVLGVPERVRVDRGLRRRDPRGVFGRARAELAAPLPRLVDEVGSVRGVHHPVLRRAEQALLDVGRVRRPVEARPVGAARHFIGVEEARACQLGRPVGPVLALLRVRLHEEQGVPAHVVAAVLLAAVLEGVREVERGVREQVGGVVVPVQALGAGAVLGVGHEAGVVVHREGGRRGRVRGGGRGGTGGGRARGLRAHELGRAGRGRGHVAAVDAGTAGLEGLVDPVVVDHPPRHVGGGSENAGVHSGGRVGCSCGNCA